jgi:hypothetical protein
MSRPPIAAMVKSEEAAHVVMGAKGKSIPNTPVEDCDKDSCAARVL